MVPVLPFRPRPAGSDPDAIVQVNGAVPPVLFNPTEYATPVTPSGSDVVVMFSGAEITIDKASRIRRANRIGDANCEIECSRSRRRSADGARTGSSDSAGWEEIPIPRHGPCERRGSTTFSHGSRSVGGALCSSGQGRGRDVQRGVNDDGQGTCRGSTHAVGDLRREIKRSRGRRSSSYRAGPGSQTQSRRERSRRNRPCERRGPSASHQSLRVSDSGTCPQAEIDVVILSALAITMKDARCPMLRMPKALSVTRTVKLEVPDYLRCFR